MDILEHLTKEHREAEKLMKQLSDSAPGAKRERVLDELVDALNVHMLVEEQYLYPIVDRVLGHKTEQEAETEHSLALHGLVTLQDLIKEPGFGAAVDMLQAGVGHHVKEEENEIFPKLRRKAGDQIKALDPEELEARVRSEEQTRQELYERARAANISGRSKMSKHELVNALSDERPHAPSGNRGA
jgi:hemerythrin-like domain-containing protein